MPRQTLRLAFVNTSGQTVGFDLVDVSSVLGDFAANPDHLALAPGQRATIDPMVGTYPANLDELDVTVTLRQGEHEKTQVIKLTAPPPPPGQTPPAAAPAGS